MGLELSATYFVGKLEHTERWTYALLVFCWQQAFVDNKKNIELDNLTFIVKVCVLYSSNHVD